MSRFQISHRANLDTKDRLNQSPQTHRKKQKDIKWVQILSPALLCCYEKFSSVLSILFIFQVSAEELSHLLEGYLQEFCSISWDFSQLILWLCFCIQRQIWQSQLIRMLEKGVIYDFHNFHNNATTDLL